MEKKSTILAVIFVIIIIIAGTALYFFREELGLTDPPEVPPPPPPTVNDPPEASFEIIGDTTVHVDDLVEFDGSASSDPDGEIELYLWDFGDGSLIEKGSNISAINHTYLYGGEYEINFTVRDDIGAEDSSFKTITVIPRNYHKDGNMFVAAREGIAANASESFEVEEEALQVNVSLSFLGVGFDGGLEDAEFEIFIYDPFGGIMDEETITVSGNADESFEFTKSELKVFGDYTLEVTCLAGGGYINYSIDVIYQFD